MESIDTQCSTGQSAASAEEIKQHRREKRAQFLAGIRDKLEAVSHQLAFSPTEAALVCGKSPTWSYRKIYDGTFRAISSAGRLMIPRNEIEHFLSGAQSYNPQPKAKIGGEGSAGS